MDGHQLLKLYRQMLLMRRFEEATAQAYTDRKIGGFLHLYTGQEAVGAGVIEALRKEDYLITGHRLHAQYLARGGTAREAMAELFGKATGISKGRGGSMHFFAYDLNFLGGWGIVGAHVPIAAGVAFAAKYRGEKSVTVCFLGEGAVSIGPFHEGMCLAALWKLPVVYIIENNFYATQTPLHRTLAVDNASVRALGYPMARATYDGVDVVECYGAASAAIERARIESLPTLLEFKIYRYHSKEEAEEWKLKDPLSIARNRINRDFPQLVAKLVSIEKSIEDEIQDAVAFAENSLEPDPSTVEDYTYVSL